MIRAATRDDVPAMLAIYAPYILETAITFEYEVPSPGDFMRRFEGIAANYPWIVWEENGAVLGYAYGGAAFSRAAYAWDADLSIYLDRDARGRGIGAKLYRCLEEMLARRGFHNLYGVVTGENLPSIRFHERMGYVRMGTLVQTGYKLGRWHDVVWLGKRLRPAEDPGKPPVLAGCTDADAEIMARFSD